MSNISMLQVLSAVLHTLSEAGYECEAHEIHDFVEATGSVPYLAFVPFEPEKVQQVYVDGEVSTLDIE